MKKRIPTVQTAATLLATSLLALAAPPGLAAQGEFNTPTIDIGVVVSDVEKAVAFYTEAVGFKEVQGFTVPKGFARKAGLTAGKELKIRVLVLGEGEGATKLKLMQVDGAESKKGDNAYIHSQLGLSYLTIHIKSTDKALQRLEKVGVKPIAQGPVTLPEGLPQHLALTIVRDPDGNFVELVGPKPSK